MHPTSTLRAHPSRPSRARLASFGLLVLAAALAACGREERPAGAPPDPGPPTGPVDGAQAATDRLPDTVTATGLWSALPLGAVFTPCASDELWVLEGGAELERRVRLERPDASGPVPVTLRGARRGGDTVAVEAVVAVHRDDACPGVEVDRALEGTAWQLSGLPALGPGGDSIVVGVGAWLRLVEDEGRVEGSTGCLPLAGRFVREVTRLRFHALSPAPGACPGVEVHGVFLEALARTGSYRVRGGILELLGEEGTVAALRAPDVPAARP